MQYTEKKIDGKLLHLKNYYKLKNKTRKTQGPWKRYPLEDALLPNLRSLFRIQQSVTKR